jgi:hypothetical protein
MLFAVWSGGADFQRQPMPPLIEIKGLAGTIASVRDGIKEARAMGATVQHSAAMLAVELKDLGNQIEAARADIKFEAQTLGNSSESGEAGKSGTQANGQAAPAKAASTIAPGTG